MEYLYILYSKKLDKYYIGSTEDLARRLSEHNRGQTQSTKSGTPWVMSFSCLFPSGQARLLEQKLKRYKSRKIIEMIINDGYIKAG